MKMLTSNTDVQQNNPAQNCYCNRLYSITKDSKQFVEPISQICHYKLPYVTVLKNLMKKYLCWERSEKNFVINSTRSLCKKTCCVVPNKRRNYCCENTKEKKFIQDICFKNSPLKNILKEVMLQKFLHKQSKRIFHSNITIDIPMQYNSKDFKVQIISDESMKPNIDGWSIQASEVIYLGPHGKVFHESSPIIVTLPLGVAHEVGDTIVCYTSDTDLHEKTDWQILDTQLNVNGPYVQFHVTHFSLFTIIITRQRPRKSCNIKRVSGGIMNLTENHENFSVSFQSNSFTSPVINASLEVLYSDTFYVSNTDQLAAPVISLGPSGCQFHKNVTVTIPLPKAPLAKLYYGKNIGLRFKCSQTSIGCAPEWKEFHPCYTINWNTSSVQFNVQHFTLFSVFWNILDVTIPEPMKLHASHHLPHFSFWVHCQALMTDINATQFGLCILCQRFGSSPSHLHTQYPYNVGTCNPKKVKSGKIEIQLKSGLFSANESVGESKELLKTIEFDGHDSDIHFACQFNATLNTGVFGKVEAISDAAHQFSFNLIKGNSNASFKTNDKQTKPSPWECKVTQELAGILSINGSMCQELALALGYNRVEMQTKFTHNPSVEDPLQEMLADFMSRGGQADEFTNAMYRVARTFKLLPLNEIKENQQNRHMEIQRELQTKSMTGDEVRRGNEVKKRKLEELKNTGTLDEVRFDEIAGEISKSWKSIGRKLNLSEVELNEIDTNYNSDGEKEKAFQMLITWRERDPDHCLPYNLYQVIDQSGLKYTANKLFH